MGIQTQWAERLELTSKSQIPKQNFHLTLQFLGQTDESLIIPFEKSLGARSLGPSCSITLHQALAFPSPRNARVLVLAGSPGISPLVSLVNQIHQVTQPLGFKKEERIFIPHISLFRFKELTVPREIPQVSPVSLEINQVALFESSLTSEGSIYKILKQWALR